jgi:hypothetical protein
MSPQMALLSLIQVPLAKLGTEYYLFGGAGLISLIAFGTLIAAPAVSSFSRPWEKVAAGVLSIFVLVALVLVGLAIGLLIFYNWDTISNKI